MRTSFFVAFVAASSLCGCGDKPDQVSKPNLTDATSAQTVATVQKEVARTALPKADSNVPLTSYAEIKSGNQLMFSYLALAAMPVNYEEVANHYLPEYSQTSDEFKKNDLLTALKPKINAAIADAKTNRYYKLTLDNPINKFDFEKKGFPVADFINDSSSTRYYSDNAAYQLSFTNTDSFRYLTVSNEADARKIEAIRSKFEELRLVVYVFAQESDVTRKFVKAQIVKIVLTDRHGDVLAAE